MFGTVAPPRADPRDVLPLPPPPAPRRRYRYALLLLTLGFLPGVATLGAQDVEEVYERTRDRLTDKPVRLTGGINLTGTAAYFSGAQPRYDRYGFQAGANLNFDILGVNAPFSLYFSDKNLLYRLPSYQFAGVSPSYRWARFHLGDRNLNFSPYTYADQTFRGVGVELTPGRWSVKAMGGRLRYQSLFDVGARSGLEESYRREGYAGEVGYRGEGWDLRGIVFGARDRIPDLAIDTSVGVAPAQNLVTSLIGGVQLPLKLRLEAEYARSFLTADRLAPELPDSLRATRGVVEQRSGTQAADVIRVGLTHSIWRVGYLRVAPGYRSLGTLFVQDDRDNLTAGFSYAFRGKGGGAARPPTPAGPGQTAAAGQRPRAPWTLSVDGGLERLGIGEASRDRTRRWIGQALVSGQLGRRLAINASFSNFSTTSRLRGFLDPTTSTDSIFLAQVNRSAQLGASLLPTATDGGVWTAQLSLTDASTLRDGVLDGYGSTVTSAFLSYFRRLGESTFLWGVQGLLARTEAGPASQTTYGPSVNVSKAWLDDRLVLGASAAWSFVDVDEAGASRVLNLRPSLSYDVEKLGRLTLTHVLTDRSLAERNDFTENLLTLNYAWSF